MVTTLVAASVLAIIQANRESFQISRPQLEAFQIFQRDRVTVIYPWDTSGAEAWSKGVELPSLDQLKGDLPLIGIKGHAFWTTQRTLAAATSFKDICYVNLSYCCRLSDDGIKELTKLKHLQVLVLYRTHARYGGNLILPMITGDMAKEMRQPITDQSLDHISKMTSLRVLYLGDNDFSEAAMMKLVTLNKLTRLEIDSTQISE
ncbi:MAG: hypothetical protein AB8G99_14105, partial [Planctomycetaceae bacterium]